MPAALPPDEAERMAELRSYDILDSPPEQAYDDIAHLAAEFCGTPMAFVNLLDADRQWFKARVGLSLTETPREYAFCSHTILDSQRPLVIRDAEQDERFVNDPLVSGEPYIRFYAGTPLVSPNAHVLGTLSVMDFVPRELAPDRLVMLQRLARQVVALLELRRAGTDLRAALEERGRLSDDLARTSQDLHDIIESVPDIIYVLDDGARLVRWNGELERATGLMPVELRGRDAMTLFPAPEQAAVRGAIHEALNTGDAEMEANLLHKDGSTLPYWFTGRALRDPEGTIVGLAGIGRDITTQKEAQAALHRKRDRLEKLTHELRTTNHELESFAYTVSHDLRAPLRGVERLSEDLLEDHASKLHAEGQRVVERLQTETKRMGDIIEDLLRLSRGAYDVLHREEIDLTTLAHEVVDSLRAIEPRDDVEVDIQENMVADGDWHLLRIVLENLLGNAWKYTTHTRPARISVTSQRDAGTTIYTVRDTGPGFDPARAELLFEPFQRLHGQEFEGTGIGLATVKRIITRHGGRVWAEGEPGAGAAFHFTLPPPRPPARSGEAATAAQQ